MRTFYINNQTYKVTLNDEHYYIFLGLKDLFKKNIIKENEMFECLKIEDSGNIIYDLEYSFFKASITKQIITKEILSFYNHKYQPRLDKIIKLLKSIISFDVSGFEKIENLYIENNKHITIYNYIFDYSKYKHHKYEEYKIICLLYEYLEKIDINTLLFSLGYFVKFY